MKIGWLVWEYSEEAQPKFYEDGKQPDWGRKVRIVYAEVIE